MTTRHASVYDNDNVNEKHEVLNYEFSIMRTARVMYDDEK